MGTLVNEPNIEHNRMPATLEPADRERLAGEEQELVSAVAVSPATAALWVILATVLMLFAGFTSAYLIRRAAPDWVPVFAPPLLWANTALLLFSSLALEIAKTGRRLGRPGLLRWGLQSSAGLGGVFLAGQWIA